MSDPQQSVKTFNCKEDIRFFLSEECQFDPKKITLQECIRYHQWYLKFMFIAPDESWGTFILEREH